MSITIFKLAKNYCCKVIDNVEDTALGYLNRAPYLFFSIKFQSLYLPVHCSNRCVRCLMHISILVDDALKIFSNDGFIFFG